MKEGQMYCEHCGNEIHIVPDFEPEIENSIHATLSNVATEIETTGTDSNKRARQDKGWKKIIRPGRKMRTVLRTALLLFAALVLWIGVTAVQYFIPEAQYKKAVNAMEKSRYEKASAFLERAVLLSPNNVSYQNGLSECYYEMGKLEEAARICQNTISLEGSNEEAYARLVSIYEEQQDYESICKLMQNCKDRTIQNLYLDYTASPPGFDMQGGTYHEVINLRLISSAAGEIYYTLDGSDPDENAMVYTAPILLEPGSHTVKARFINQYGMKSEVVSETYYIEVSLPDPPAVSPGSGTYTKPCLIELEVPEGCKVYYTTDRSDPGVGSTLYEEPFWMPAGNSVFRFVSVSPGGVSGEIVEMQYTLNLHPVLSMEAASNQLMLTLKNAGFLLSLRGDVPDKGGRNLYTYKYALTINDHHYYLYREYYEETSGTSNSTGNDYVVNYMSGECYRAVQQEDKSFKLYTIEAPNEAESQPES